MALRNGERMRITKSPAAIHKNAVQLLSAAGAQVSAAAAVSAGKGSVPEQTGSPLVMPSTSVEMLVVLAASLPRPEQRRRLVAEADRGLGYLEDLCAALLKGKHREQELQQLVEWLQTKSACDEADFDELYQAIELRVRVELAKFDMKV